LQHQDASIQYNWHLVRNTKRAFEASDKAEDPDGMNCFIAQGNSLRQNGGIFEFDIDGYCRVSSVYRQTARNKQYLDLYGDYVSCDGTHLIDKFGNLLLLLTVLDCLGVCQCGGTIVAPAENADILIKGFTLFGVKHGKTRSLHTDGGPWGPVVAEAFDRMHFLCANHFTTKKVADYVQLLSVTGSN
jgi:hypothetical protein